MRLLLDTCTFLWLFGQQAGLSSAAREAIADSTNPCFLSSASFWEILVKHHSGRLDIDTRGQPIEVFIEQQRLRHDIDALAVDEPAVTQLPKLPDVHRDPFDRMLICQAIAESLTIVTPDPEIHRYPVRTLW